MRMGILPGALVKFRAESRYGESINRHTGMILPANTDGFFPLTTPLDDNIPITVTSLNYTQFLSDHIGVTLGKFDTLEVDRILRAIVDAPTDNATTGVSASPPSEGRCDQISASSCPWCFLVTLGVVAKSVGTTASPETRVAKLNCVSSSGAANRAKDSLGRYRLYPAGFPVTI